VTAAVLELSNVSKDYRGLRPLRITHLAVGAADAIALLGFDRTSAEVFVNLVTGATLPDSGDIRVFGRATSSIADSADWLATLDRFGLMTHRAVLLDALTVIQNLAMPFTLDVDPPPGEIRRRAEALAAEVGLADALWPKTVGEIDPAARIRVRLGRALAADPAVLLVEHPTADLPRAAVPVLGDDIRAIAARREIAVVAATADEEFARAVATRVLVLEAATGRLLDRSRRRWFG